MTTTASIDEVQNHLRAMLSRMVPGDTLEITDDTKTIAVLTVRTPKVRQPRKPGSAKGKLVIHSEDDEHLADFKDYM